MGQGRRKACAVLCLSSSGGGWSLRLEKSSKTPFRNTVLISGLYAQLRFVDSMIFYTNSIEYSRRREGLRRQITHSGEVPDSWIQIQSVWAESGNP